MWTFATSYAYKSSVKSFVAAASLANAYFGCFQEIGELLCVKVQEPGMVNIRLLNNTDRIPSGSFAASLDDKHFVITTLFQTVSQKIEDMKADMHTFLYTLPSVSTGWSIDIKPKVCYEPPSLTLSNTYPPPSDCSWTRFHLYSAILLWPSVWFYFFPSQMDPYSWQMATSGDIVYWWLFGSHGVALT